MQIILALDLSVQSTGYCFMDLTGQVLETGTILPAKYKNHTKDKYPKKTIINIQSAVSQISELVSQYSQDYELSDIVIEEINPGKKGTVTTKILSWVQGLLLAELGFDYNYHFITSSQWRSALKLKFSAEDKTFNRIAAKKDRITFKHLAISFVNSRYKVDFKFEDNDTAEAICIGLAYLKGKGLTL